MAIPKEKAAEVAKISLDTDAVEVYSRKMLKAGRPDERVLPTQEGVADQAPDLIRARNN
jgi:hypothetical protein